MSERPIIFSAPMVPPILSDDKTQTRRIIKPKAWNKAGDVVNINIAAAANYTKGADGRMYFAFVHPRGGPLTAYVSPYAVGDRMWVREAHAFMPKTAYALPKAISPADPDMAAYYREGFDRSGKIIWRPSIHMPRWASRITLEVTEVRVQRLQEISEEDARAEGVQKVFAEDGNEVIEWSFLQSFGALWNSLHGPGAWEANPWVVAVTFKRVTPSWRRASR